MPKEKDSGMVCPSRLLSDDFLLNLVNEALAGQNWFRPGLMDVQVVGGVVHLKGEVLGTREQTGLRRVLSRIKGVHGIWDVVSVRPGLPLQVIDIGCGSCKQVPWAIGVDAHPYPGVDVVTDLERSLPFEENATDHVFAIHVLEHIHDLIGLMNEIHRILKPEGVLHAMVPRVNSNNAVADPTHVRFFNKKTFGFFCRKRPEVRPFRPINVSCDVSTVYVDFKPVKCETECLSDEELDYYFGG
jgi:SAM-dependent methyltransferase